MKRSDRAKCDQNSSLIPVSIAIAIFVRISSFRCFFITFATTATIKMIYFIYKIIKVFHHPLRGIPFWMKLNFQLIFMRIFNNNLNPVFSTIRNKTYTRRRRRRRSHYGCYFLVLLDRNKPVNIKIDFFFGCLIHAESELYYTFWFRKYANKMKKTHQP